MEYLITTLILATLPVALLLAYFWHRDRGEKEPFTLMRNVFLFGILVVFPVGFAEVFLMDFAYQLFASETILAFVIPFLVVALPEEFSKLWIVKKAAYNHSKFNEFMDGITYCILASMGFAMFENIVYTYQYGLGTGILRAFTAVPAHALFSGIMGYYIGLAKFSKDPELEKKFISRGLWLGVFYHGLYDFLLLSGLPILALSVFPLLGVMAYDLNRKIHHSHTKIQVTANLL
jgi:RsiW-degrading membrane proteinase PrsW (M82 family)